MGRKPKPTIDKILDGNPGRRPLNPREPVAVPGLPECPDHLNDDARKAWFKMGAMLVEEGRMGLIYEGVLATYCVAWSRWREADRALEEFGLVVKSPNGHLVQSPYLPFSNRAMEQLSSAIKELGVSPSSQAKISTVGGKGGAAEPADPLQQYIDSRPKPGPSKRRGSGKLAAVK